MNDYKELIEILRDDEYYGKLDFVYEAADAIEQLVKERDTAVEEIPKHCGTCRRFFRKEPCLTDDDNCGWEWRGVQDECRDDWCCADAERMDEYFTDDI